MPSSTTLLLWRDLAIRNLWHWTNHFTHSWSHGLAGSKKVPRKQLSYKTDLKQNSCSWSRQKSFRVLCMCTRQLLAFSSTYMLKEVFSPISKADLESWQQSKVNYNKSVICRLSNKIRHIWPLSLSFSTLTSPPIHSSFQYRAELTYFTLT